MDYELAREAFTLCSPVVLGWMLHRLDAKQQKKEDERKEQDRIRAERERQLSEKLEQLEATLRIVQEQEHERFAREEERIALIEELNVKMILVMEGLEATIKDRLNQSCLFYIEKQKWIPVSVFGTITKMFESYKKLGGNGEIERLYEELKTLPLTEGRTAC